MLRSALDFPTDGEDGPKAVLIGGGLLLLAVVAGVLTPVFPPVLGFPLLALLLVRGYQFRVLRAAAGGADTAPAFERWGDLVVDGLTATIVRLVYLLPALAFAALALAGNLSGGLVTTPGALLSALQSVAGFGVLFFLLYLVVAAYVVPAAVTNVAYENRFGAAFEFRRITSGAFSEDYAVSWVVAGLLQLVAFPIALILLPLVVGFFVQFLVAVAARYLYGRGFAAALGLSPLESGVPGQAEPVPTSADGDATEPVVPAIRPLPDADDATAPEEEGDESSPPDDTESTADPVDPLSEETSRHRDE
jgi:hypothetical protein